MDNNSGGGSKRTFLHSLITFMKVVVIALLLNIIIKGFLIRTYTVDSSSMQQTLLVNDKVITEVVTGFFSTPERGDIIVFVYPETDLATSEQKIRRNTIEYARYLLAGIGTHQVDIDEFIRQACEHWRIDRIAYVDKNVLRIGIFEMIFSDDVPPKVAIDEAIEMGKKYGSEDSREFINGVLDRILKDHYTG